MTEPLPASSNGPRIVANRLLGRDAFDPPDGVAYLNCTYVGPLPRAAVATSRHGLETRPGPDRSTCATSSSRYNGPARSSPCLGGSGTDAVCSRVSQAWERLR
jgi:hypothetical protein